MRVGVLVVAAALGVLNAGCADLCIYGIRRHRQSKAQQEVTAVWTERLNSHSYTRDDAVKRYGPPAESAALSDGGSVDVWIWNHGTESIARSGPYNPYGTTARAVAVTHIERLTLTFSANGVLSNWSWTSQ